MPDQYLTVNDFLAYDKQLMGKLGRISDNIAAVAAHVQHLDATFTDYRAENDAFRIQVHHQFANLDRRIDTLETGVNRRIDTLETGVNGRMDALETGVNGRMDTLDTGLNGRIDALEQTITQGFALIFAHLGIHRP